MAEIKKLGGYRVGAGRKTKYEKTSVIRVPEKYIDVIRKLIEHLDDTSELTHDFGESEPIYIRSLQDKKQHITFVTEPIK